MAVGDTIAGEIRVVKESRGGDRPIVAGPYTHAECDQAANPDKAIYHNVGMVLREVGLRVGPAFGAGNPKDAPDAIFEPGEIMEVQHQAQALAEAIDFDAAEFNIGVIEIDLNKPKGLPGRARPRTLSVAQTELVANPTSSTTAFVTFWKDTTPDRVRRVLAGFFAVAAVENA